MKIILCAGISVRSGTNFMGSVFSEIPDVASIPKEHSHGEFPFFRNEVFAHYEKWIENFNNLMFSFHPIDSNVKTSYFFGKTFMAYLREEYGIEEEILFVKDPGLSNIERFYEFFPEGKLIVLTRNAPDLISSSLKASLRVRRSRGKKERLKAVLKYYSGYNMVAYCRAYNRHAEQLKKIRESMKGNFLEVRYENMFLHPKETFSAVLEYCEIPYDSELLESMMQAKVVGSSYFGADKHAQKWGKLDRPSNFSPIDRYKSWGPWSKFIYRSIAAKGNRLVGYKQDV